MHNCHDFLGKSGGVLVFIFHDVFCFFCKFLCELVHIDIHIAILKPDYLHGG